MRGVSAAWRLVADCAENAARRAHLDGDAGVAVEHRGRDPGEAVTREAPVPGGELGAELIGRHRERVAVAGLWAITILPRSLPNVAALETLRRDFAVPIERYGSDEAAERLRRIVGPFLLRRVKSDPAIIQDLPRRNEMKMVCTLTREQATLYKAAVDEEMRRIERSDGIERRGRVLALLTSGGPLPRLRAKLRDLSDCFRYEDAARLRDRIAALERVTDELRELERLRRAELCLLVPAADDRCRRAYFVAGGRVAAVRTVPPGAGGVLELESGIAEARAGPPSLAPEDADELLLVGSFVRPLRRLTQHERNREPRWHDRTPSGWALQYDKPTLTHRVAEYFYYKLQYLGSEWPGRQKDVEKYRSGWVTPAERAYGGQYQLLPAERAALARQRGTPRRSGLDPQAGGVRVSPPEEG